MEILLKYHKLAIVGTSFGEVVSMGQFIKLSGLSLALGHYLLVGA